MIYSNLETDMLTIVRIDEPKIKDKGPNRNR